MLEFMPSMSGVRTSFMVGYMTELARRYDPAREAFTALRDRNEPRPSPLASWACAIMSELLEGTKRAPPLGGCGTPDRRIILDWIRLNRVIGDEEATLSWFDRFKDEPSGPAMFTKVERDLFELLTERDRWPDIALLYPDPVATLERDLERWAWIDAELAELEASRPSPVLAGIPEALRVQIEQIPYQVRKASRMYVGLLAAGRDDDAARVAAVLLDAHDTHTARLELINAALQANEPRSQHMQWLEQAEAMGGEELSGLRSRLERALRDR